MTPRNGLINRQKQNRNPINEKKKKKVTSTTAPTPSTMTTAKKKQKCVKRKCDNNVTLAEIFRKVIHSNQVYLSSRCSFFLLFLTHSLFFCRFVYVLIGHSCLRILVEFVFDWFVLCVPLSPVDSYQLKFVNFWVSVTCQREIF